MKTCFILIISLVYVNIIASQPGPGSQSFVNFTSSPECEDSKNGKIRIMIEDDIPPPWSSGISFTFVVLERVILQSY